MGFFSKKQEEEFFSLLEQETESYNTEKPQYAVPSHALTPDEVLSGENNEGVSPAGTVSPLQSLKKRMQSETRAKAQSSRDDKPSSDGEAAEHHTILERVRAYTTDENGVDAAANTDPIYKLESVAEIIRRKNDDLLSRLSDKFDVRVDDLGREQESTEKTEAVPEKPSEPQKAEETVRQTAHEPAAQKKTVPERTEAFEQMVSDAASRDPAQFIFEELFPGTEPLTHADLSGELPDISDIDNRVSEREQSDTAPADTATIRFTPIKQSSSDTGHIAVSSTTRPIDLTGELAALSPEPDDIRVETRLEENEFESYSPEDEYSSPADAKRLIRKLSVKKRSAFLRSVFTGLISVILALFLIPPLSNLFVAHTRVCACVCAGLLFAAMMINIDAFAAFKNLFGRSCTADTMAALQSLGALALAVAAVFKKSDVTEMLLLSSLILFARALCDFKSVSAMLGNLRQITGPHPKRAVTLISDPAISFAMAKNAVEGDALIAAPQRTGFVSDFMKHSTFGVQLSGKLPLVFFGSLILSVSIGLASGYYFGDMLIGLHCTAAMLCIAAAPILFFIDSLPESSAASRLNRKGAMIAGKAGAKRLELANAAVLSSGDIFPDGTVTLHSMKVLSDNNIDTTIMRAASLTDTLGSTLAPIFKRIAGTNASYTMPDSDTVKYEERLGLSGWVDNELLFIGNRTLMEAHGIEVPSVEIDRKILRQGYFPVYLASGGKACALIVIQYSVDPNVARELKHLTNLGITLLVNNCDPNISEAMICDYIGLYEDSVRIMTNAGVHMYKGAVTETESCSAPAALGASPITFVSILNCASRMKRSGILLTVCYILAACIGAVMFAYMTFTGQASPPLGSTVLIYELAAAALSIILFLTQKP